MSQGSVEIELDQKATWTAAIVVLFAMLGGGVVLAEWPLWGVESGEPDEPLLVEPSEGGTELWPYTARAQDHATRTLGINMVFYGDSEDVHTALTERSELEWEDEQEHEGDADAETISPERVEFDPAAEDLSDVISWTDADGSTRYTYFKSGGDGEWTDESYQLHAGTYLGYRLHIRAYDDPQGEWTAVQVHDEHWDWFRLRHTVTGISDAQRELERDFIDQPFVEEVVRMPFDNDTADGDGWATGITIAGLGIPLLLGVVARGRRAKREVGTFLRDHRREVALGVGLFALYTAVRWLGIAGELAFPGISPKVVAAPLYVALVVGTPAIAYVLGKGSDATWAFTFAVAGFGTALVIDFVAMNGAVLPIRVVLHRGAVLLAVGLVAVGGAQTAIQERPPPLVVGLMGWGLALALPLLGYL